VVTGYTLIILKKQLPRSTQRIAEGKPWKKRLDSTIGLTKYFK